MFKIYFNILLFFIFQLVSAQESNWTHESVAKVLKESGNRLRNLECDKSIMAAKIGLKHAIEIEDNELIAKAYNLIAVNLEEFSDYDKAISFYNKGLLYANKTKNDTIKEGFYINLGNVYSYRKNNFKKGIENYNKALIYITKIKDTTELMFTNLNIASAYFRIDDYQHGLPNLKTAAPFVFKSQDVEALLTYYSLYCSYYYYIKDYKNAEINFKEAIRISKLPISKYLETTAINVYRDFSKLYYRMKKFDKAYLMLNYYNEKHEKIYNEERTNLVGGLEHKLEVDEFKRQIDKNETQIHQSSIIIGLFVLAFIILIILLIVLNKTNKYKKNLNSKLAKVNEELIIAKINLDEALEIKSQFISTITHELRTPLYGVIGMTDILITNPEDENKKDYLESLKFSAKYLLTLVNDVLKINKLEESSIVLENSPFNLFAEINSMIFSLQFLAQKENNSIILEYDAAIPKNIIGDKNRFSQVIMNLVSNAIKYTKNGKIIVKANLIKTELNRCFIQFEVIDNGIGISKENQEKIFEKFFQIERTGGVYEGTGVGLFIVNQIITLFGSSIHINSEEGKGTTFYFVLDFEIAINETKIINNDVIESTQGANFLIVDDNDIGLLVTSKILERNNYLFQTAKSGSLALELLKTEIFDIILMDLNMPEMNGFETAIKIREMGIKIPIIAFTAASKVEVFEAVFAAGMNDIIFKPIENNSFIQTIENHLNK